MKTGEVEGGAGDKPLVVSLCGTYLKREMQSLYRQMASLRRHRGHVMAEVLENLEEFPAEGFGLTELRRRERPRHRGNSLLRFWYKHVVRQWPPPRPIGMVGREGEYYHPYDLVDRLEELEPALVHVYYGHKAVKYREMLEAWGGPWIVSFHGVDAAKFLDRPGYREELGRVFCEARLVLGRSGSLLARLEELGCPAAKLRLNRTPIQMGGLGLEERVRPGGGEWRLLQACRLVEKKGILTLLDALALLRPEYPCLRYELCGDGPLAGRIAQRVSELGLEGVVEMRGWVGQAELREAFRRAHLFVHPSETTAEGDQEGVPNALLEAMAVGLPVVATRHGGIPEAVSDGVDGLLVGERDAMALAGALRRVFEGEVELGAMSAAAGASVREKYGAGRAVAALEDCYEEARRVR